MSNYAIISDSGCDLPRSLRERFNIDGYLPGYLIYPDGHEAKSDLDWTSTTPEEFFGAMNDKKKFLSTAQASPAEVREFYETYLKSGRDILAITLSSGISGTYNSFQMVAAELREEYPQRKIAVIDSLKYSSAVGLLCIYAALRRDAGISLEENAAWLEENKFRLHQMGALDDLFFCSRMGRVSGITAISGTLINIKPLADFDREGRSHKIGTARGLKNTYRVIIEYIRNTITEPEDQIIIVDHSLRETEASTLKKMIEENFHPKEVLITTVGQSCGVGIGPGLFAAFYFGTEISEDLVKETELLNSITSKK